MKRVLNQQIFRHWITVFSWVFLQSFLQRSSLCLSFTTMYFHPSLKPQSHSCVGCGNFRSTQAMMTGSVTVITQNRFSHLETLAIIWWIFYLKVQQFNDFQVPVPVDTGNQSSGSFWLLGENVYSSAGLIISFFLVSGRLPGSFTFSRD